MSKYKIAHKIQTLFLPNPRPSAPAVRMLFGKSGRNHKEDSSKSILMDSKTLREQQEDSSFAIQKIDSYTYHHSI